MARPKRLRKIDNHPPVKGFLPIDKSLNNDFVIILLEEYESIRLCDYESKSQEEAASQMGVSRPTFTRIYAAAREKVAKSFAEGKGIVFKGGKVYLDSEWFSCQKCNSLFNNYQHIEFPCCTLCGSNNTKVITELPI